MRAVLMVGAMAGLAAGGDGVADPLLGKWETVSVLRGDTPDEGLKGAVREHVAGNKYSVSPAAGSKVPPVAGTYTLDTTQSPPHLDMTPASGRYKGQVLKGVYKLDGEALVIAFAEPGQPRPADTTPKPNRVVATHKRLK